MPLRKHEFEDTEMSHDDDFNDLIWILRFLTYLVYFICLLGSGTETTSDSVAFLFSGYIHWAAPTQSPLRTLRSRIPRYWPDGHDGPLARYCGLSTTVIAS